jgi:DNA-binding HxlR family transcriptional regulator
LCPRTPDPRGGDDDAPLPSLIHGKARLIILSHLHRAGATPFTELRALTGMTDGALSVHLSVLERGGMITIEKGYEGKKPRTVLRLTDEGRRRFAQYVRELRKILPGLGE